MIYLAGEPDDMWWGGEVQELYLGADLVWKSGPTIDVYEVSMPGLAGVGVFHPLVSLEVPPGRQWEVTIEGSFTATGWAYPLSSSFPVIAIGQSLSGGYGEGGQVSEGGVITSGNPSVGVKTNHGDRAVTFTGTVTVTIP